MAKRIVLAALLGGLTLFAWGAISHVVLQLADRGLAPVPEQDRALLDGIRQTVSEPGIYLYPGMDPAKKDDPAAMEAWIERTRNEPHGLLVVNTYAYGGMGRQLVKELVLDVVLALVAALVLSRVATQGYAGRVALVGAMGLFGTFRTIQHWNWFEFPGTYSYAQILDCVLGFLALGLVVAAVVKPAKP